MLKNWLPRFNGDGAPRYVALANSIIDDINGGTLRPGNRLPARRDLAYRLGVSVNTVGSAYMELERRGFVQARVGSGTYIQMPNADAEILSWHLDGRQGTAVDLAMCTAGQLDEDESLLRETFRDLANSYAHAVATACRPVIGHEHHRVAGRKWLRRLGLEAPTERVIITNGNSHGLLVTLSALAEPGDLVLCEELTSNAISGVASMLHFQLRGLPIDAQGIIPESFQEVCQTHTVKALVTTPNFNNPTCTLMTERRRMQIAEIARRYGVSIVENDPYGALAENTPPPLSTFAPELSHYMTTLSKSAACLRTGYLVVPESSMRRVAARIRISSWKATPLIAEIAARWVHDDKLEDLVLAHREELRKRQKVLSKVLKGCDFTNFPTGPLAWLRLPVPWRANAFAAQARFNNVEVTPAEPFVVGQVSDPQAVRISVSMVDDMSVLESALKTLRRLLSGGADPSVSIEHI